MSCESVKQADKSEVKYIYVRLKTSYKVWIKLGWQLQTYVIVDDANVKIYNV